MGDSIQSHDDDDDLSFCWPALNGHITPFIRVIVIDTVTWVLSLSSALGAIKLRAMSHFDKPNQLLNIASCWVWTKLSLPMDRVCGIFNWSLSLSFFLFHQTDLIESYRNVNGVEWKYENNFPAIIIHGRDLLGKQWTDNRNSSNMFWRRGKRRSDKLNCNSIQSNWPFFDGMTELPKRLQQTRIRSPIKRSSNARNSMAINPLRVEELSTFINSPPH